MALKSKITTMPDAEQSAENLVEEHALDANVHKFAHLNSDAESAEAAQVPIVAWAIVLLCLGAGVVLVFSALKSSGLFSFTVPSVVESSKPTPTSQVSPTPSVAITKTRSDIKIRLLNGSGTPGYASLAKAYLESLGYKNVDTGNADSYEYDTTNISVRPGFPELTTLLTEDLKTKYKLSDSVGTLPTTGTYDVEVVLGTE